MKEWRETKYGVDGANMWLLYPGIIIIAMTLFCTTRTIIIEDFSGAFGAKLFISFLAIYLTDKLIFGLFSVLKLKTQVVVLSIDNQYAIIQCYFENRANVSFDSIASLDECHFGYWYLRYSFLSNDTLNYCLTTKNNQKFYISGDMPEVNSLITTLRGIIQSSQNP